MSKRVFARGRGTALSGVAWTAGLAALATATIVTAAGAASISYGGFNWSTDRADPQTVEALPTYQGMDDVLHLQTFATTTVPSNAGFYQTEGIGTLTGSPVGAGFVSGEIFIPSSWSSSNGTDYVNAGLWGVVGVPPTTALSYPIINFYNGPAADPAGNTTVQSGLPVDDQGEIRVFDGDQWVVATGANAISSTGTIEYGAWNTFRINYNPGATPADGTFDIVLNGTVIATLGCPTSTDTCSDFTGGPIDPSTASIYSIILNSRTNGSSPYDVYWANIFASLREEYYDAAAVAPIAIVGGEQLLGTYTDRRGLDWDSQKAAWGHMIVGQSNFDDTNTTVDAKINGAQLGLDLFALGDPSTRAGVTFAYGSQSAGVALPASGSAGTISGNSTSVGGYLTHADRAFYADLLGQYRFLNYDVTAPTSNGKVSGGSVDAAAEAGFHLPIGGGFSLTPMGQLVYEHVTLNDTSLGGMDVTFGDSDALIARARLLAQATWGGMNLFASAGASTDVLGAKQTTIAGTDFTSTTGGPQAEFTAGLEGKLAPGFSLFGSGEYDVSFDGKSQTYVGQAGFRSRF